MTRAKSARRLMRNPAVAFTEIDGEIFLVEPGSQEIYRLNSIASALWRFLAEPHPRADVLEVFAAAFPKIARKNLKRDLAATIKDLSRRSVVAELD